MHTFNARLLIRQLRTQNAVPPVSALLVGYFASGNLHQNTQPLAAAVVAIICLMFFATLQNDITDYALDNAGKRQAPLNTGLLQAHSLQTVKALLVLGAGACAVLTQSPLTYGLFAVFLLMVWLYNQPPTQYAYRPIASLLCLGMLLSTIPFTIGNVLGSTAIQTSVHIWLLAGGLFVHRVAVSCLKDYKDYTEDMQFNKHTFLIKYGGTITKRVTIAGSLLGYAMAAVALLELHTQQHFYFAFAALVILAAYMTALRMRLGTQVRHYRANGQVFQRIFDAALYFDLLVAVCLYTF